jgi:hypothetical protein
MLQGLPQDITPLTALLITLASSCVHHGSWM